MRGDDRRAEQAPAPGVDVRLREALGVAIQHGPIDIVERDPERDDAVALRGGIDGRDADVRNLGRRERAPRDDERRGSLAPEEQGVLDRDARHGVGGMRELVGRADVAGGKHLAVRSLQVLVDGDAGAVEGNARAIEPEPFDVRGAPRGQKDRVCRDRLGARPAVERDDGARLVSLDTLQRRAEAQGDALAFEDGREHRGRLGVFARQELRLTTDDGDAAAEARERLRHFAPDGAGADHDESRWKLREREERLVGVVAGVGQPRHREGRRTRARGEDGPREREPLTTDLDRVAIDERRVAEEHVDAEALHASDRVVGRDARAQAAHTCHHAREVRAAGSTHVDAEVRGRRDAVRGVCRSEERLRRDAAVVEAVAAQQMPFDQCDLCAEAGSTGC